MSTVACERCKLTFEGEEGRILLARCRDPKCPMKKSGRSYVVPLLISLGVTALTIAGAAAGISWIAREPTANEEAAERRAEAEVARNQAAVAAARRTAVAAQPAPDGGTGIARPSIEATPPTAPVATGPLPPINPVAAARVTSFSCGGKLSAGRALVCSDVGLAISDYNLALLYDAVRATRTDRAALRRSQDLWKAQLDRIGNDRQRVAAHYRHRFDELSRLQAGLR